jgi:DNA-binding SARP family transcriptional activator
MRLHLLAGDRTAALRQYEQCVQLLQRELAVKPATSTIALYERICSDRPAETRSVSRTIEHLKQVQIKLAEAQAELQRQVHELEVSRGD